MNAIPSPVQALLDIFQGALSDQRFGDIDANVLAHHVGQVTDIASDVEAAEVKLAELRQALAVQQEMLMHQASRALAYARVYAENDADLAEKLAAITLMRPAKRAKTGPAAREVNKSAEALRLFDEDSASPELVRIDDDPIADSGRKIEAPRKRRAAHGEAASEV